MCQLARYRASNQWVWYGMVWYDMVWYGNQWVSSVQARHRPPFLLIGIPASVAPHFSAFLWHHAAPGVSKVVTGGGGGNLWQSLQGTPPIIATLPSATSLNYHLEHTPVLAFLLDTISQRC